MSQVANIEIRNAIKEKKVHYYEVAHQLGIHDKTFCCWLRYELPTAKREMILKAIDEIKA